MSSSSASAITKGASERRAGLALGIGVDAHGNLIYAAADDQTAQSLAQILQRVGAVRAMELDINYEWTTFNFYGTFGAGEPAKLLPDMNRLRWWWLPFKEDSNRSLSPFFGVAEARVSPRGCTGLMTAPPFSLEGGVWCIRR